MLPLERHRQLLSLLNEQSSVRTAALAKDLGVTQETVRRDFEKLEKDGVLLRTHGGAVKLETARREFPVRERAQEQQHEKEMIARDCGNNILRLQSSAHTCCLVLSMC